MVLLAGVSIIITPLATSSPASAGSAGCGRRCPTTPVQQDGNNIVGRVESQVNMLNSGDSGSGQPQHCTWTDNTTDPPTERNDGVLRWRPPGQGHDYWAEGWEGGVGNGTIYRFECWHDDMGCRLPAPSGVGCLGEAVSGTFCGSFLCVFDAVNPQNLALLAVDQFVRTLGPPHAQFSPSGETLVRFETWMWVDNVPASGALGPWTISVPGQSVTATASLDNVVWEMGNGETVNCPITTDEASAQANCRYAYDRSSVGQPDNAYQGTVSVNWHVVWNADVLGNAFSGEIDAPRTGTFGLAVSEAQALNED